MSVIEENIEVKSITLCPKCKWWRGYVKEKYNGVVPVHFSCTLDTSSKYDLRSPSMICPDGKNLRWTPISDFKVEDGGWLHVPHFG